MKLTTCIALSAALVAASACKKDEKPDTASSKTSDKGGGKADKGGGKADKADKGGGKAPAGPTELTALGLVIDLPGEVSEMMGDQMIQSADTVVLVGVVEGERTLEAAIEDSKMYDGSKITKQDKLADGFHLEYSNTGAMGANYFVEIVRKIGDKTYDCGGTLSQESQAAAAAKACLSLRAK